MARSVPTARQASSPARQCLGGCRHTAVPGALSAMWQSTSVMAQMVAGRNGWTTQKLATSRPPMNSTLSVMRVRSSFGRTMLLDPLSSKAYARALETPTSARAQGRGLTNMIEMAPETARGCEEKREGRGRSPGRAVRRHNLQPFQRRDDVDHLPGYFVAKDLKAERLPAPPLRVSEQMASHHFDQIYEFTT